jgi:hypothetical protein
MDEAGDPDDDEAKKKAKEAADAEEEEKKKAEEKAAADAAEEEAKKKEAADKAAMDAKHGMDAAEVSKLVAETIRANTESLKRRDALAKQLGPHVGTFDHSDMSEAEVAAYGAKKLGIQAAAGTESAVLQGYLLAASKAPVAKTTNAMDAGAADFVTAYLTKKEG